MRLYADPDETCVLSGSVFVLDPNWVPNCQYLRRFGELSPMKHAFRPGQNHSNIPLIRASRDICIRENKILTKLQMY